MAKYYGVPVVLHTDHCHKKLLPWFDGLMTANEVPGRGEGLAHPTREWGEELPPCHVSNDLGMPHYPSQEYFSKNKEPLFSSHMLDLSEEPLHENLDICKKYLARMHKVCTLMGEASVDIIKDNIGRILASYISRLSLPDGPSP